MLRKEDALVVVAIDFGTTYSGFAYSFKDEYKKDHTKIKINTHWKSDCCLITPKIPTAILFDSEQQFMHFGYDAEDKYAELLEEGNADGYYFFKRYKMKLFQNEPLPTEIRHWRKQKRIRIERELMIADYRGKSMGALKVFSDSIRFLKDAFTQCASVSHFNFEETDIHWVLTIPAIWKDNAKQFMREAAQEAGIKREMLSLAYEPEAAAIYMKEAIVQRKLVTEGCYLSKLEPGQQFMLLDCGGGTIDVTSYEVQTNSKLRELDKPSGGPWGGICVDQEYVNTLQKIFSTEVWENFSEIVPEDYLLIERQFEAKKRGIGLNSERKIIISFPSSLFETFSKLRPNITLDDNLKALGLSEKIRKKSDKLIINPEIVKPFFRSIDDIILHVKNLLLVAREKGNKIRTILW